MQRPPWKVKEKHMSTRTLRGVTAGLEEQQTGAELAVPEEASREQGHFLPGCVSQLK